MILNYFGLDASFDEINDFIVKATPDGGSFLTEIARYAKLKSFRVDCHAYNLYLTDPKDSGLSKENLLKKLEKELRSSKRDKYYDLMLESTIKAIKEGVNYVIQKPNFELVRSHLREKIPLVVRVNYSTLHDKQGDPFESHDIVLCGLSGNRVYFVDPENARQGLIDSQSLMFAMLQSKIISASAYLLAIRK